MSIKFFIPDYDGTRQTRASYRFRATIPLKGMRPEDGIISSVKQATKGDIVVLAKKSKPKDVYYLKAEGIKCVYDICDNKWRKYVAKGWVERIVKPHNEICQNILKLSMEIKPPKNLTKLVDWILVHHPIF